MHKRLTVAILLIITNCTIAIPTALAEWYFGAKAGPMLINKSGVKDPTNAGVTLGYELPVPILIGDLGIEAEVTTSIEEGTFQGQDIDIDTAAVYGALRTAGPLYLKARFGYVETDVSSLSGLQSGTSAGLGVGLGFGLVQLELEFTVIEENLGFANLGVQF